MVHGKMGHITSIMDQISGAIDVYKERMQTVTFYGRLHRDKNKEDRSLGLSPLSLN